MNKQIIFVDSLVENYQSLIKGIEAGAEIVALNANRSGIEQITAALAGQQDIAAVHIVSHGSAGSLQLGTATLNRDTLDRYASQLQQWQQHLSDDADILLYGCNVAQGAIGTAFVEQLAALTGADVAASENITGSAAKGGDWNLEVETGSIEAAIAIDSQTLAAYDGVLPTYTATDFSSLVNAINNANSSPGADTIDISTNITLTAGAAGVTPLLLPIINSDITFVGNGNTINANSNRLFFISGSGITVNFGNLNITGARGQGGAGGGYGGGGGAGMGGALFVDSGTVNITSVTFSNNQAVGGAGSGYIVNGAGGGGGFGGNGGNGGFTLGGGGGGGFAGSGANGISGSGGTGGSAGSYSGGTGGNGGFNTIGGAGGVFAGGGGGDGSSGSWNGGPGGFGGGGGAGSNAGAGGIGGFGGGGGRGQGAAGGTFGGQGGFSSVAGGGGAGLGGAIFVRSGTVNLLNSTFNNNTATGGLGGGGDATAGQAKGGAIFVNAGATVTASGLIYSGNSAANAAGTTTDNNDIYGTLDTAPTATSFTPADNATSIAVGSNLVVQFSEAVAKGTGNIVIKKVADNSVVETIDVTSASVTVSSSTVTINTNSLKLCYNSQKEVHKESS